MPSVCLFSSGIDKLLRKNKITMQEAQEGLYCSTGMYICDKYWWSLNRFGHYIQVVFEYAWLLQVVFK